MALPTPRALLTTLITSISTIPLLPKPNQEPELGTHPDGPDPDQNTESKPNPKSKTRKYTTLTDNNDAGKSNPLRRVPASHRHLITTLHVLFPGMVLPALDALERGLVGKVTLSGPREADGKGSGNGNSFYLVHSASAVSSGTEGRRRRGGTDWDGEGDREGAGSMAMSMQGRRYVVRLGAWHCTCAAFAFAAVADVMGEGGKGVGMQEEEGGDGDGDGIAKEAEWSFGGVSLDGLDSAAGGSVPVCKHLLACLLAEKWSVALGRYVVERRVGREEMAGIVADV